MKSFRLERGEHCFLYGPSGSGKSTLLNLIAGVLLPQSGNILLLETNLGQLNATARDRFRANHIGFIFQQFNLIPYLSILQNVMLPCRFSKQRLDKSIRRSGSVESEARYLLSHLYSDDRLDISQQVLALSVGQQQRVAAARALMGQPDLIIADEPTSALDADSQQAFMELLFREIKESASTLMFVSHDLAYRDHFKQCIDINQINNVS